MAIRQRDRNRAELVKAIIRQNGGRIFTVIAKRKAPKVSYVYQDSGEILRESEYKKLGNDSKGFYQRDVENFMTLTCRTGVTKELKGGASTIAHHEELVSVNLTNGKGYRCFSAYNVLEIRAGGTKMTFREEDVLSFEE